MKVKWGRGCTKRGRRRNIGVLRLARLCPSSDGGWRRCAYELQQKDNLFFFKAIFPMVKVRGSSFRLWIVRIEL